MLSGSQALANAAKTTRWAVGMCDNFVANMFGYSSSGYPTASNHWSSIPGNEKHPGDLNAPAGALMFWGGGAGHVAISDGHGGIFSTDYPTSGMVSHVDAGVISGKWGKPYLGWSVPVFQGQDGTAAQQASFSIPGVPIPLPSIPSAGSGLLDLLTGAFSSNPKDLIERAGIIILGTVLMIVGLLQFTSMGMTGALTKVKGKKEEEPKVTDVPDADE